MADNAKKLKLDITSSDKSTTESNSSINITDRINTELNLCTNIVPIEKHKHLLSQRARYRVSEDFTVIWLDFNINESDEETSLSINKLQHIVNSVRIFNDANECIDFLTDLKNETVFMIIASDSSQWIAPLLEDIPQLHTIYILDSNQTQSEHWIKQRQKVQGTFTLIDTICNALKRNIRKFETNLTSISIVPDSPIVNFDELDQSFMYSQILKEIIIEIKHDEKAKKEFVNFCRGQYSNNDIQLNNVNKFECDYEHYSPIWWYTKETFIYTTLNQALRKQDIEMIMKMGFFVRDLHRQIEQIHSDSHQMTKMTIYRGQGMANIEFEKMKKNKGGLISFNNFLSTSIDRQVSFLYADSARGDPDLTGILFQIEIDTSISSVSFATLDNVSFYSDVESEILFSMHTIFRIGAIEPIEDRLWQVNLTLTSDNDQQLIHLAICIRNEIGYETGWVRMAGLMFKLGKFDKAIEIYNTLLKTRTDGDKEKLITSLPAIFNNSAASYASLGNYSTALEYFKKTLDMMQKLLPSNHPLLARAYNNIGTIHRISNELSTAFSYYEKAIEIVQSSGTIDDTELAVSYCNMGNTYEALGDYSTALSFYEKTRDLDEKYLPSIHPDLAATYFNIGRSHESMGRYTSALTYFKKALKIEQKSLPPYHSHLASTYRIIGGVYQSMGESSTALSYYDKTIEIEEKSLPSNHPDRAVTFNNIGEAHVSLGDYSTALSYYKKSLEIRGNSLSFDPIGLAATYNNIGLVHESMEDYPTALSYYEKALELEQKSLSPNHPQLAITYSNIGGLYQSMEDYPTALSYYKKTLEIQQGSLELDHPDLAITYNDIGLLYKSMEDYPTALSYYEMTLDIQKSSLPSDHPHLAATYHNMGDVYTLTEDYPTALSYYDKAIQIKQKSLPSNHPTFATIYNNIGEIHRTTEEYSTALAFYEKTLEVHLQSFSPNDLSIADQYNKIGLVHKSMEDYPSALSYYRKALEIQERCHPSNDSELTDIYDNITELLIFMKDYSTALSYTEKILKIEQKCLPSDDPSLIIRFHNMALLLDKLSRYEEAIEYAERAVDIAGRTCEPDHSETKKIQDHISELRLKLRCT